MIQLLSTKINYRSKNDENNLCGSHGFTEPYARSSGFYGSCCQATSPNLKISLWAVFTLKQKKTYLSLQPSLKVDV